MQAVISDSDMFYCHFQKQVFLNIVSIELHNYMKKQHKYYIESSLDLTDRIYFLFIERNYLHTQLDLYI